MRRFCLILLVASACAQANGFRPNHVQSNGRSSSTVKYLDNVTINDLLYVCESWKTTGQTLTVSDTLTTSFSYTTQLVATGADGPIVSQCAYGVVPSTGSDTITISGITVVFTSLAEFNNISGTVDVATTASTTSGATTLTTTPTTTVNGDLCISFQGQRTGLQAYTQQQVAQGTGGTGTSSRALMAFQNTGIAGAQSLTIKVNTKIGNPAEWGIITSCFLPSSAAIVTSALPHGAQTTPYKATLQEVGLVGAETWSATAGLPGWASVSSAGVITGTPNANGCHDVTFQVVDPGPAHTATRVLSLCAGTAFATPTLVQHKQVQSTANTFTSSVTSGNLLIANLWDTENSGATIWWPTWTGANNKLFDSLGTVWTRISPLTGTPGVNGPNGAPISTYVGCATSSGSDTVDFSICDSAGTCGFHGNLAIEEWSGLQPTVDDGALGTTAGGAAIGGITVTTANYSAQVANEVLHWLVSRGQATAPTLGAPFTTIDSAVSAGIDLGSAYYIPGAAGTYTATDTEAGIGGGTDAGDVLTTELIGLRPAISGLPCGGTPVASATIKHKVLETQ